MGWMVTNNYGIYLPQVGWHLDAHKPVKRSFISHAHFDHMEAHERVLCSDITAKLIQARMGGDSQLIALPFGQPYKLSGDTTATLYPAGHVFGSAQILLENARGKLLYTGDFKLRHGLSAEPCATPQADVVIMETTYGLPKYVFPPTQDTIAAIIRFCQNVLSDDGVPILYGYSLGKGQELLASLEKARLPIMLHAQTAKITREYERLGVRFPVYSPFKAESVAGHVVICPPQSAQSVWLNRIENKKIANISGWAMDESSRFSGRVDTAFPLSDHADYNELLAFVHAVQPKIVYTVHGFAEEFAADLRSRGIEAWALGKKNQLEFLEVPPQSAPLAAIPSPANVPPLESAPAAPIIAAERHPADFLSFALVAEAIRAEMGKLDKIRILADYLATLDGEALGLAALYFTGRPFPQHSGKALQFGWSQVRQAVLTVSQKTLDDFRAVYRQYSDSGDTAEILLKARADFSLHRRLSLSDCAKMLDAVSKAGRVADKASCYVEALRICSAVEGKYLVKIVTGDLRIGLKEGLVEEAIAKAFDRHIDAVREANQLSGAIDKIAIAAKEGSLASIELTVFNPVQFMLASPEPDAASIVAQLGAPVWTEYKYDGIRCQLHKSGRRAELFSRDLRPITHQFPEIEKAALGLADDFILDGELLAWRKGRALPFAQLQKRLGRSGEDLFLAEEMPVAFIAYDMLWQNGASLIKLPLRERRAALEALAWRDPLLVAPLVFADSAEALDAAFLKARNDGNEGLVCKDARSPYQAGRRGLVWLKLKKVYATLDVVVVAVEYGHGKRSGVLSDYTFAIRDEKTDQLLTIGKAYSGLTDAEIASLTAWFLENTTSTEGRLLHVVPEIVLEIGFDAIQPSKRHGSGLALRFPRILRIRNDKTAAEIDTLSYCQKLAMVSTYSQDTLL